MKITVTKKAQKWFESEMGVSTQRGVRFLGKVYGCSPIHEGFSLAVEVDQPNSPIASVVENGITYFVESGDEWFFQDYDLAVDFDEELNEPSYNYNRLD
ncbi:HesB/YadR/YfhF family protein [Granulicatella seriolae]|uniref:Iron-sulfur cluster biosynthesis protein n=1 Tax=Granulicatella seriolae TaxID=2967226 RepID=A0ABT1WRD6_9LACT|nr:iron-sulfur cluster biosynthesis protein [Granulicatella seriolae]